MQWGARVDDPPADAKHSLGRSGREGRGSGRSSVGLCCSSRYDTGFLWKMCLLMQRPSWRISSKNCGLCLDEEFLPDGLVPEEVLVELERPLEGGLLGIRRRNWLPRNLLFIFIFRIYPQVIFSLTTSRASTIIYFFLIFFWRFNNMFQQLSYSCLMI